MNQANSNRVTRLKKRFLDVLSGSIKLDPRGTTLFLQGLCAQDDPVICLNTIMDSTHGLASVQSAMKFDLSVEFMSGLGSSVLEHLLRASDVGGDALDNLLFHIVEPPIFWDAFVRAFQQDALTEDVQLVFARLLSRLLTLPNRDTTPYRVIAAQRFMQDSLVASSKHEIREVGHLIKHVLSSATLVTASCVLNGPGGRHDNDFADYRKIAILPTADEILCRKPPFLRTAFHEQLGESETPVDDYLDHTFRMLRQDMLFDIREEVETALQEKKKRRSPDDIDIISVTGIYTGMNDRQSRWGIKLQCSNDFRQLKNITGVEDRVEFLTQNPRGLKITRHQSLACLVSGQDIISFGTVNRVEELLACNPPVIVLQLDGTVNISRTLTSFCDTKNVRLIQIDAAMFSFEPVLTALQTMKSVPLATEILSCKQEKPTRGRNKAALSRIANMVTSDPSVDLSSLLDFPTSIHLDNSQARSLITGLTKRVSLIQGPPGTGKSFIGAILAKTIHDKTSQTILVVCYTNHALDQFLGDLLNYGIPSQSMVRLGGRPSQSTEHLSLRNQPRGRFQYAWDDINELRVEASVHESQLQVCFRELFCDDDPNLTNYLQRNHPEFSQAFCVPPATKDGMTLVGENGRAIDKTYLFSRWVRGLDAGVLSGEPHVQASPRVWGMGHSTRQQLLATWRHERVTDIMESICKAGIGYNASHDAIKQAFGESAVAVLRQKRIIACTTTGAAIYAEAIKAVGPRFLLVEEAGEILESHILTSLSHKVDRMILIGDHKQLRPKVNDYELTVEKGEGFDLNRSLFERLVLKGYPHETLSTQHRMRPQISAFVRELTYPELVDAPSTHQRPDIRGVQSNIIFVNHSHPEDDNTLIGDRADGGTKSSKQNTYEVQMTLRIVRYLAQQGYKSEDIVVLTPYLGQLHRLRDALNHDNDLILNDMDSMDLAHAGLSTSAPPGHKAKKSRIHLATIDNYQGEESDIVIASLTRSNTSNAIGFMDSPERLNVLLSRARNGLILIGNAQTFLRSKKGSALWTRLFDRLEKGGYVYRGFPAKCERHPGQAVLLERASDFDGYCPEGGCTAPCGFVRACGHACTMRCHPYPYPYPCRSSVRLDPHDMLRCTYTVHARCRAGLHAVDWQCRVGPPERCVACEKEAERLEVIAIAGQIGEQQRKREEDEVARRRQMAIMAELERVGCVVEDEGVFQKNRADEFVKQEEEKRKREEDETRKKEEKRKKREEKKKRKEEKQKRREEKKKRKREEKRAKKVKEMKRLQEAIRHNQEGETKKQGEQIKGLQQATHGKREAEPCEDNKGEQQEESEMQLLREATRRRIEQYWIEHWAEEWKADKKRQQESVPAPVASTPKPAKNRVKKMKKSNTRRSTTT